MFEFSAVCHKTVTLAEYYISMVREIPKMISHTYIFFSIYTSYTSKRERRLMSAFFFWGVFMDRYVRYCDKYGILQHRCPFFGIINKSFAKFVQNDKNSPHISALGDKNVQAL